MYWTFVGRYVGDIHAPGSEVGRQVVGEGTFATRIESGLQTL